jgi:hypothetical protein
MTDPDQPESADFERELRDRRPIPSAGFRSQLRSELLAAVDRQGPAPQRLRLLVAAYSVCGIALLAVAAAGLGGVGPLAS